MLEILQRELVAQPQPLSETVGLTEEEAVRRVRINGKNKLSEKKKRPAVKIFANQFKDFMVMILLAATVVSALLGEAYDAITIVIIVLLNALLGFIQEFRTEHTLEALEKMTSPTAKVYRDGNLKVINAEDIAEGDVFEIEAGDRIPCDAYIETCRNFSCDESVLTGESVSCEKYSRKNENDFDSLNISYMVYMGTICTKGTARCVCTSTGLRTQMGKVSGMLKEIPQSQTPLQKKLNELGKLLGIICLGVCLIVFLAGVLRGEPVFDMVMTAITIAIASIPEGLPATVTVALALAVRKMLKKNALVRRLHSVESLGCADVICTDKTGTVTENKMTVTKLFANGIEIDVATSGNDLRTAFLHDGKDAEKETVSQLSELFNSFVVCNNAKIYKKNPETVISQRNRRHNAQPEVTGESTETALLLCAAGAGLWQDDCGFIRIDEIPFDSAAKFMTVLAKAADGRQVSYTKGAVDVITARCGYFSDKNGESEMNRTILAKIMQKNDSYASQGLRVLAFCKTENSKTTFLGLCAMSDPLRADAKKAIKDCEKAHIKTVMITGDHKLTACAVAREAGIFKENSLCVTGDELSKMSDGALKEIIDKVSVFARITPNHKLRIVKAFKEKGHIVAMTGDGVNDAPAIKEADIGVSMGTTGTDVSKQAADVILLDDSFSTLTLAVREGRTIYANIRKFVRYLISCNIGEIITMLGGMLLGLPIVLLPTQLLLVNLATDGLPAVALGLEPCEESVMKKPPRKKNDSFFSGNLLSRIAFRGVFIGAFTILSFIVTQKLYSSTAISRTCALFTLVASQLIHVFECKSEEKNLLSIPILNNVWLILAALSSLLCLFAAIYLPPLQMIFNTAPLTFLQLMISFGCAFAVPLAACFFQRRKEKK